VLSPAGDGSGPLRLPIRVVAGALGFGFIIGGAALTVLFALHINKYWMVSLSGVAMAGLGVTFLRAAWTGRSPSWDDLGQGDVVPNKRQELPRR